MDCLKFRRRSSPKRELRSSASRVCFSKARGRLRVSRCPRMWSGCISSIRNCGWRRRWAIFGGNSYLRDGDICSVGWASNRSVAAYINLMETRTTSYLLTCHAETTTASAIQVVHPEQGPRSLCSNSNIKERGPRESTTYISIRTNATPPSVPLRHGTYAKVKRSKKKKKK